MDNWLVFTRYASIVLFCVLFLVSTVLLFVDDFQQNAAFRLYKTSNASQFEFFNMRQPTIGFTTNGPIITQPGYEELSDVWTGNTIVWMSIFCFLTLCSIVNQAGFYWWKLEPQIMNGTSRQVQRNDNETKRKEIADRKWDLYIAKMIRWVEYFFTSPLMIQIIAYSLLLVNTKHMWMFAFFQASVIVLGGIIPEVLRYEPFWSNNQCLSEKKTRQILSFMSIMASVVVFAMIWVMFFVRWVRVTEMPNMTEETIPGYVVAIFILQFILFFAFGVVGVYDFWSDDKIYDITVEDNSKWHSSQKTVRVELGYSLLSLVSKSLLVILFVAFGVFGQNTD
jgi:hypothetical protein